MERDGHLVSKFEKVRRDNNDWALLPFDEEEDDRRWARLLDDTVELENQASDTTEDFGKLWVENPSREIQPDYKNKDSVDLF